jgi:hypothetical protein
MKLRSRIQPEPSNIHIQTRMKSKKQEEEFYHEFEKIFNDSQKAWRKNKVAIGEGCFTYKD